jgi:metaxin
MFALGEPPPGAFADRESMTDRQIHPPTNAEHLYRKDWASSNPSSLRAQLLFLLRDPPVRVAFRPWANENSAPEGKLPALHVTQDSRLVASDDIRSWLDTTHPIKGKGKV